MTTPDRARPSITIPDRAELERRLSVSIPIEERVSYVRSLLRPVEDAARAFDTFERELADRDRTIEGMRAELKTLHQKLDAVGRNGGDAALDALDARHDMLGKINRARGELQHFEHTMAAAIERLQETLKK